VPIIPIMTYNPLWRFQHPRCVKIVGRAILSWPRHLQSSKALALARQLNEAVHSLRGEIFVSRCIKILLFCCSRIRFSTRWCVSVYISWCIFFPHSPPILVLCQVSLDMLAVLVPRIPSEAWMFQWKVGRNESNDRKRRKAYGQCLSRKRAEKGGNLLGECKMVTCHDMSWHV
jgi:hypothetical protein